MLGNVFRYHGFEWGDAHTGAGGWVPMYKREVVPSLSEEVGEVVERVITEYYNPVKESKKRRARQRVAQLGYNKARELAKELKGIKKLAPPDDKLLKIVEEFWQALQDREDDEDILLLLMAME